MTYFQLELTSIRSFKLVFKNPMTESDSTSLSAEQDTSIDIHTFLTPLNILRDGQSRSVLRIFRDSIRLYAQTWMPFTATLAKPLFLILAGCYGCLAGSYVLLDLATQHYGDFFYANPLMLIVLITPFALVTLSFFIQGFWEYLVYFSSLGLNAAQIIQEKSTSSPPTSSKINTPDFKAAYQCVLDRSPLYTSFLVFIVCVQLVPVLIGILGYFSMEMVSENYRFFTLIPSVSLFIVLTIASVILSFLVALGFQLIAFEPELKNAMQLIRRSLSISVGQFIRIAYLISITTFIASYLIPELIYFIFKVTKLITPIDQLHIWLTALITEGLDPSANQSTQDLSFPLYDQAYQLLKSSDSQGHLGTYLSKSVFVGVVNALLLPFGTYVFTMMYLDIRYKENEATI